MKQKPENVLSVSLHLHLLNNPHLSLTRKEVPVCLEGVQWVSNMCLEGIRIVSGFWKVSERSLEGVWKVSGGDRLFLCSSKWDRSSWDRSSQGRSSLDWSSQGQVNPRIGQLETGQVRIGPGRDK